MTLRKQLLFVFFLLCQILCAQQDSIVKLEEVLVSDSQLKKFSNSQSVQLINDSIIRKNRPSLTSLLNYNTVIYFKENGLGMVSSPSFRGTTAQQTAVLWNGININSQFNGQTDFNTLSGKDFNAVSVRAGGGSAVYGSSAIGGSIHLDNNLNFSKRFDNTLQLGYGSFNTANVNYNVQASEGKFSSQLGISRNSSDNDYPYPDTNQKNENGQFYNTSVNLNIGYKLNAKNILKIYSYLLESERHFSGTLAAPSKSKYEDLNVRSLAEWAGSYGKFISKLKAAFLSEKYKYYENAENSIFNTAHTETFIVKYDLNYKVNSEMEWNAIIDYTQTKGVGKEIGINTRQIASGVLLLKHSPFKKFLYELAVRKELTNNYRSPVLFSVGTNYSVTNFYKLKINGSRNFRIPTFNDLYWQGSGNNDLKPESSYQIEVGNDFKFRNIGFSVTGYYIKIKDLLRWTPGSGGSWAPGNVANVSTYGAEVLLHATKRIRHNQFDLHATYGYTVSRDAEKEKQLIYVPFHKFTASLAYSHKNLSAHYQYLYNGKVFTSSDNFYSIEDYLISNAGVAYSFGKKKFLQLGFDALNIFNEKYQSVSTRPMPGRNYTINLTFNL